MLFVKSFYLFFSVNKLNAKATTGATALALFHRYNQGNPDESYDPYLIACSCIYLSGKAENDHLKMRDVINVTQTTLKVFIFFGSSHCDSQFELQKMKNCRNIKF